MNAPLATRMVALAGLLLVGVAAGYGIATWRAQQITRKAIPATSPADEGNAKTERKVLYWYDPMYPQHKFDQPGKSPFMDMQLVPKYADDTDGDGVVRIDPAATQSLGVRLGTAQRQRVSIDVSAVATVGFNERDVAVVQARTDGFVERVYAHAPGDMIVAGAPLADVFASEWTGAQEEFLAVEATGEADLTAAARRRLVLLGMSEAQIQRLERTGRPTTVITIVAPIGGVIQELGIRAGMSVSSGMTLVRINGLRTVWLEAAVPEVHAGLLEVGSTVEATFAAYPDQVFQGKIAAILPEANVQTRTLRVRMEFANPKLRLKPGMFAQVYIAGEKRDVLAVPSEAVIRTGKRTVVFVSENAGRFRPVQVEVGQEVDGKLVVLHGIEEGQQIVLSGQFLIDSEASMRGVVGQMDQPAELPVAAQPEAVTHEGTGTVTEIKREQVTLSHGPIPTLQWGPMTMPFKLSNPPQGKDLKPGDRVRFRFRQAGDEFVIQSIEKAGGAQ